MRLGISGFFLDKPMTGSGQYVINLLRELEARAGYELLVFCPSESTYSQARQLTVATVVRLASPLPGNLGKVWFEQVALPRACRKYKIDLLHVPYFGSPLFSPCKTVVTVHDLIMLVLPQHRGSLLVRAYTSLVSAAAKRANIIIADSHCTKRDVAKLLGIPEQKVRVVYLACEEHFQPVQDPAQLSDIRRKYGLEDKFVLYLGGLDWRKNVASLIRAFTHVGGSWQLAIAGEPFSSRSPLYPDLTEVVQQAGAKDRVKFLGLITEEDKPALYSAASLFVFPSLYEGFGLPPLEALACGTPVLCSNASSLPEVVGEGAMLFDPQNEDELGQALASLLSSEALRSELREAGLRQARRFSWRQTAKETLAAYKVAASDPDDTALDSRCHLHNWNIALRRALHEVRGHRGRTLEAGCGGGRFIRAIVNQTPGLDGHGCDISSEAIALARSAKDSVAYTVSDLLHLPYADAQFDVVFAFDVLEHLYQPDRGIAEAYRVLKPAGVLHALVPCEGQPFTIYWLLGKLNIAADVKHKHSGHIQRFSHRELLSLLADRGFQVTKTTYSMHPLGQIRDFLTYLAREQWAARWRLGAVFAALKAVLWPVAYIESNLLSKVPLSAVAMHVTAKKR
jgi:glycosyltransferase involved in cell wall biosynthesis/ubiquinone/menaquinone biosynthesis C-methylase UbiE